MEQRDFLILDVPAIDEDESTSLVLRIREQNPGLTIRSVWHGPRSL